MQATEIKLNQVLCGKSEEQLAKFPDNFFDGIVTDPPYEINFMGKDWDASGIACSIKLWKEVLRTAKPGSFLLCFGGTRTFHRVVCAIEDAGWIIKDQMMWIYGEGFPKSTNISKQIDKEAGVERTEVIGENPHYCSGRKSHNWCSRPQPKDITAPATNDAKRWDGYGTGLKPGWEPIIVAMKPLEQGLTYAQNAKKWNVAGLNIDGGRIGTETMSNHGGKTSGNVYGGGNGIPPIPVGSYINKGRWPSNVILSHSPDCVCVGTKDEQEVYACVLDCPIRIMDGQSGTLHSGDIKPHRNINKEKFNSCENTINYFKASSGGASRFFYCAKAKRSEKEAGLIGFAECVKCGKFNSKEHTIIVDGEKKKEKCCRNNHPTVKPLDLMRYLCNLIKMPSTEENKQIILDPFCGSGTTLVALEQLGINYIGIDQDSDSVLTSIGRIGA